MGTLFETLFATLIIICGGILAAISQKLTVGGMIAGWAVAFMVFIGAHFTGLIIMATFFATGVIATGWKATLKFKKGLAENKSGIRNAGQVLANASAPALAGVLFLLNIISQPLALLIIAACFSSAIADTLSSELGNVYGRKYYNILTLKKDQQGLNGVVSLEGFLFGLAGSILIAGIYSYSCGWHKYSLIIIIAGTAGNLFDSALGATVERKGTLNNDAVNFLNTAFAGVLAAGIYSVV